MSDALILDCASLSALGNSSETWAGLMAKRDTLSCVKRFPVDKLCCQKAFLAGGLDSVRENLVMRLAELCLSGLRRPPPDTRVIWCGIKEDSEFAEKKSTGMDTSGLLWRPAQFRGLVAERLGLCGAGMEVNAACAASAVGLALGAEMIKKGACENVLVCGADIVCRFTFTGFAALKALTGDRPRPFDRNRSGLILGDGAAAVWLGSEKSAEKAGVAPMARISGWGVTNDANHITGPDREGAGLASAMRKALAMAAMEPDAIEAFCAHGTGTAYNDAMELKAAGSVFGRRKFPAFSVKGSVGHTLGAAGALEADMCARALACGTVPPTAGLETPEDGAEGMASPSPVSFPGRNIMTSNSGFGGVNAALILENTGGGRT